MPARPRALCQKPSTRQETCRLASKQLASCHDLSPRPPAWPCSWPGPGEGCLPPLDPRLVLSARDQGPPSLTWSPLPVAPQNASRTGQTMPFGGNRKGSGCCRPLDAGQYGILAAPVSSSGPSTGPSSSAAQPPGAAPPRQLLPAPLPGHGGHLPLLSESPGGTHAAPARVQPGEGPSLARPSHCHLIRAELLFPLRLGLGPTPTAHG